MTAEFRGGSGKRGRWQAAVAVSAMLIALSVILAGCGGGGQSSTGSQLDQKAAGATVAAGRTGTAARVATVGGNQPVLAGYTANQCIADMTARYGSPSSAQKVCAELGASYGPSTPESQMPSILPKVESKVGVTPVPGAKVPGQPAGSPPAPQPTSGGGSPSPGGTPPAGGSPPASQPPAGSGGGWPSGGIPITVPGAP